VLVKEGLIPEAVAKQPNASKLYLSC